MKNKKVLGFTLFEIMLVMLVVAFAIVAMITFTQRQTQETAAEQLGYRLFQYGMAVTDYARQNPDGYDFNNEPETFYGYEWLQEIDNPETGEPFLGDKFILNVNPLRIRDVDGDASPLRTELVIDDRGNGNFELVVDVIELGVVTKPVAAKQRSVDEPEGTKYVPDPSLAGAAATYASNYRDRDGAAVIAYRLSDDFEENPLEAQIIGEPKGDINLSDYWLQTDGGNQMQGPIRFNTGVTPADRKLTGVDSIEFSDEPGDASTISGVKEIDFDKDDLTINSMFSTIQTCEVRGNASRLLVTWGENSLVSNGNSVCFLAGVTQGAACNLTVERAGNVYYWHGHNSNGGTSCHFACLVWNDKNYDHTNWCAEP